VVQSITNLSIGGATETVVMTCRFADRARFESAVLCGPQSNGEDTLLHETEKSGADVHVTPDLRRDIHLARDLRAYAQMVDWMRRNECDIVHTHTSKAGILGRLAARKAGVPVIIHTAHGWGHHKHMSLHSRSLFVALERAAARMSHKIIAVSHSTRDRGLADGIGRPEQYAVIYSGIDIERYRDVQVDVCALRASLGIPPDAVVVGTVSRLSRQKAPEDFLEVAARSHARFPRARFVFVGGGPDRELFQEQIRAKGLEQVVFDLGYRLDVPELLRVFDVFLLTSLWEGLPRVFAQAMCASLPIVATRVDGAPEAVEDGVSGYFAEPRDCETLTARVLLLIQDCDMRARMGSRGLQRVYPTFCDRDMVRRIEGVYDECLVHAGLSARELPAAATS
jgi:glycosyltransferase involved in cell wall biosynthesis